MAEQHIGPIKRSRLSEQVMERLKSAIRDGTYKPGDQLPRERDLAEQLQVSRASIREALRSLENLGFIESRVGVSGGTYVKELTIDNIIDPFYEMLSNEKEVILEMIEFRLVIETEYARIAAERRTEEDLHRIRESLHRMQEEIENSDIGLAGDNDFHDAVAMATHNNVFEKMLKMSKSLLSKTRETTLQIKGQPDLSLQDHWNIYHAIEEGRPSMAAMAMRDHLLKAQINAEAAGTI